MHSFNALVHVVGTPNNLCSDHIGTQNNGERMLSDNNGLKISGDLGDWHKFSVNFNTSFYDCALVEIVLFKYFNCGAKVQICVIEW